MSRPAPSVRRVPPGRPARRDAVRAAVAVATLAAAPALRAATPRAPVAVEVWKDPQCGCCGDWVTHLERAGFTVRVHDSGNVAARRRLGIPPKLGSCHTGLVGGYAVEGHVPAEDIRRLLAERPKHVIGLAVPGMPVGSPGMDGGLYGDRRDPYDVLAVARDGSATVWRSVR